MIFLFSTVCPPHNSLLFIFSNWAMYGVRGRSVIQLQHRVVVWMVSSFLSSPHCHGPHENPMLESGIPERFTSLGPQENLVLCRNTWLCWTGNGLITSPPPLAMATASPATPLLVQPLPCSQGTAPHLKLPQELSTSCQGSEYTGHPWRSDALLGLSKPVQLQKNCRY